MQKRVVQGTSWKGRYYENEMRFSMERESNQREGQLRRGRGTRNESWLPIWKAVTMAECMCQSRCPAQDKRWKWRREQQKAKGEGGRSGKEKGDRRKFDRLHLDSCQASWRARNMQRILRHILATQSQLLLALATSHSRQLLKTEKSFFKSFFCQLNLLQDSELSSTLSCANSNRARQQRLILDSTLAPPPYLTLWPPLSLTLFLCVFWRLISLVFP